MKTVLLQIKKRFEATDMVPLTNVENNIDKLFEKRILQRIGTTKISLLTMRKESFEKLILKCIFKVKEAQENSKKKPA